MIQRESRVSPGWRRACCRRPAARTRGAGGGRRWAVGCRGARMQRRSLPLALGLLAVAMMIAAKTGVRGPHAPSATHAARAFALPLKFEHPRLDFSRGGTLA